MHGVGKFGVWLVVVSLVAVGPSAAVGVGGSGAPAARVNDATNVTAAEQPADPDEDVIGWENGYWHNESIAVNQRDGLTDAERRAFVGRAMARVEFLREQEFERNVDVTALSREQYRSAVRSSADAEFTPAKRAWENQVWEALFAVNESADAVRQQVELRQERVAGFFLPGTDEIYVVADGELVVDNSTLVHELTHALQDQQVGLSSASLQSRTMDGQLGRNGLTEGEASYVEERYARRCGDEWECVETPGPEAPRAPYGGGPLPEYNLAMQVATIQPYSDGPAYVAAQVNDSGWGALDYRSPPASSEQVIDPRKRNDGPTDLRLGEQATNGWQLFGAQGENGSETVGEAGIYTMFWYQGRAHDNRIIPWQQFETPDSGSFDTFDYTSGPSEGWANDRLWPVRKGDERGYVWRTAWDTTDDAVEFEQAYRELLAGQNATRVGQNTWVIRQGGFADAFHVVREGKTVTIVNAPTVSDLSDVRPSVEIRAALDGCDCARAS